MNELWDDKFSVVVLLLVWMRASERAFESYLNVCDRKVIYDLR